MSDEMLIALSRNGGVAMVNYNCGFISADYDKQAEKYMADHPDEVKRYRELRKKYLEGKDQVSYTELMKMESEMDKAVPRPPLSMLVDHIDHMVKVAGIDHVGLGSDFDGVNCLPEGINSVADLPKITEELVRRGYTESQIHKILGGNLLRVFAEVEKTAKEIQHESNPDTRKEVALPVESPKH
jgi:membrane dipeptidase